MKIRPILFATPWVLAILDGRKTQTRRPFAAADQPTSRSSYGLVGDDLWVRETWREDSRGRIVYRADQPDFPGPWKSSRNMPRSAARIELRITAVRQESVQSITREEVRAEGIKLVQRGSQITGRGPGPIFEAWESILLAGRLHAENSNGHCSCAPIRFIPPWLCAWREAWIATYGDKAPWDDNPFVTVTEFRVIRTGRDFE